MAEQRAFNYDRLRSVDQLKAMIEKLLADNKTCGFDIETGYLGAQGVKGGALDMDWPEQFIVGFSITNEDRWARYIPVAHDTGGNLPEEQSWELIKPVLETLPIIAHHAKFEERNLRLLDVKGRGPRIEMNTDGDSMLSAYALGEYKAHGLKPLVVQEFDHEMKEITSLFPGMTKKQEKELRFNVLEINGDVTDYACEDALWALRLEERLRDRALKRRPTIYQIEMEIQRILVEMEETGVAVDWDQLLEHYEIGPTFMERMADAARGGLEVQAAKELSTLNLNSTPQMQKLLYHDLGLKTTRLTPKGKKKELDLEDWQRMSTDENALKSLAKKHPAIKKVLEVRQVKNVVDRHKNWAERYHTGYDDRVHASFSQVTVAAGRFSAKDPGIQQVPKWWRFATEVGADVWDDDTWARITGNGAHTKDYWTGNYRDHVLACPGFSLMTFDYSQVELRMLAGISQEPALLEAFANGVDVHSVTAAAMLGKAIDALAGDDRAVGKTMNFALIYGMGVQSLAERLAISLDRAEELYAEYFAAFSRIDSWMKRVRDHGVQSGYVETYFKRRVPIWEFESTSRGMYAKGERLCVNAPVQGSAADAMKIAMIRVKRALVKRGWWQTDVRLINNMHDALTFEVNNDLDMEEVRDVLRGAVVFPISPKFPDLQADWELGHRWGSCPKWKDDQEITFDGDYWRPVGAEETVAEPDEDDLTAIKVETDESSPAPAARRRLEHDPAPPKRYRVSIDYMPTRERFAKFHALLKEHPGSNLILLSTPQGDLEIPNGTSLGLADRAHIQMVMKSAEVTYLAEESVDA